MTQQQCVDYEKFVVSVRENTEFVLRELDRASLDRAAALILQAKAKGGRLHISGIGKPAHIAQYLASLMSSTETPSLRRPSVAHKK